MSKPVRQTADSSADPHRALRHDALAGALAEYLEQQDRGIVPNRTQFVQRYPDIAGPLDECLRNLEWINRIATGASGGAPIARVTSELTAIDPAMPSALGDFRIVREIGRGGMGIVYEAEPILQGGRVALKILPIAALLDPRALIRFQNEAHAAATLDHPHIVDVLGVGCDHGVHYYAMRFIDGMSLAEVIAKRHGDASDSPGGDRLPDANGRPSATLAATSPRLSSTTQATVPLDSHAESPTAATFREVARWGLQAAEALDHAHQQGVIHRDIKPSNLLLDVRGKLWVTDFGLARVESAASLTLTGDMIGTLRYMSPEQTLGQPMLVDHRTDIYSLGVTLYELVTRRPLFDGENRHQLLHQIATVEPQSPRRWARQIPIALEWILLKATAKDPRDRYASAAELADDLRRFLNQQPVTAKRLARAKRLLRWSQRNPRSARRLAIVTALLCLALLTTAAWVNHTTQQSQLERTRRFALQQIAAATQANLDTHEHVTRINLAEFAHRQQHVLDIRGLLADENRQVAARFGRTFEHRLLRNLSAARPAYLGRHQGEAYCVQFSPDETQIASAGNDGVRIWQRPTLRATQHLTGHQIDVNSVAWSYDGKQLVTVGDDGQLRVYRTDDWQVTQTLSTSGAFVQAAFSPAGDVLFAAERWTSENSRSRGRNVVHLWHTSDWQDHRTLDGPQDTLQSLAVSHDGHYVAAACFDTYAYVWEVATGKLHQRLSGSAEAARPRPPLMTLAFAHRQALLVFQTPANRLSIVDVVSGRQLKELADATGPIEGLTFAPDDRAVVGVSRDRTIRVWELSNRFDIPVTATFIHDESLWGVSVARDGTIVTTDRSGGIHLRNRHLHTDRRRLSLEPADVQQRLADPRTPIDRSKTREYEFNTLSHRVDGQPSALGFTSRKIFFAPDGHELVVTGPRAELTFWDLESGQPSEQYAVGDRSSFRTAAYSSDAKLLAVSCGRPNIVLIQRRPFRILGRIQPSQGPETLAFSRDSQTLFTRQAGDANRHAVIINAFDVPTLRATPERVPKQLRSTARWMGMKADTLEFLTQNPVDDRLRLVQDAYLRGELGAWAAMSLDRKTLINSYDDGSLQIRTFPHWNRALQTVGGGVEGVCLTPDGDTIAGWSAEQVVLWNAATGRELMRLESGLASTFDLAFAPDGRRLVAAGTNRKGTAELVVWDAEELRGTPAGPEAPE